MNKKASAVPFAITTLNQSYGQAGRRRTRERRGRAAVAFVNFLAVLVLGTGQAAAQQATDTGAEPADGGALADVATALNDVAAARACAAVSDDGDRLDCYDRALRRTARAAAGSSPESAQPRQGAVPSPSRSAEAARGQADELPQAQIRAPAASRTPATAFPGGDRDDEPEEWLVTVVEVRTTTPNEALFVTNDGSVWRQTDSRRFLPLNVPFEAQIRPGALGSFFLVPTERGRAVRVTQQ